MTSAITLDSIREAAEKKYGSREVELGDGKSISLRNPLRLSKTERDELSDLNIDQFDEPVDYFKKAFALVASEKESEELAKVLGDDVAFYMALFEEYMGGVELGEASPSQD